LIRIVVRQRTREKSCQSACQIRELAFMGSLNRICVLIVQDLYGWDIKTWFPEVHFLRDFPVNKAYLTVAAPVPIGIASMR